MLTSAVIAEAGISDINYIRTGNLVNQRRAKKERKEYRRQMKLKAEKDTKELQIFLGNKSFSYRCDLAFKILFAIRRKEKK